MTKKTEWHTDYVCADCFESLTRRQVSESGGRCPLCGKQSTSIYDGILPSVVNHHTRAKRYNAKSKEWEFSRFDNERSPEDIEALAGHLKTARRIDQQMADDWEMRLLVPPEHLRGDKPLEFFLGEWSVTGRGWPE